MLKPININDIPKSKSHRMDNYIEREIEAFISSGELATEIVIPKNRTVVSVRNSYSQTVRRKAYPVSIICRQSRIFIIKEAENA